MGLPSKRLRLRGNREAANQADRVAAIRLTHPIFPGSTASIQRLVWHCVRSRQPLAPLVRISGRVEHAVNLYRSAGILVEDRKGKSSDQGASIIFVHFGMEFGHATDSLDAGIDAAEKLLSQPVPTIFLPVIRLANILLGFRRENQFSGHIDSESLPSRPPKKARTPACSSSWPCVGPVPLSASRG